MLWPFNLFPGDYRILDKDQKVVGHIKGNKIYDKDWKVRYYLKDGYLFDKDWQREKKIDQR